MLRLVNAVVLATGTVYPGDPVVLDRVKDLLAAGALFADDGDSTIASAAAVCQAMRGRATPELLAGIMQCAVLAQQAGQMGVQVAFASANYVASPGQLVVVDTAAGDVQVTVPATKNKRVTVKKFSSATPADANNVNIVATVGNVDKVATYSFNTDLMSVDCTGTGTGVVLS